MRKFLAALAAAVAFTAAGATLPAAVDAAPATTGPFNPYAAWACGATRQSEEHILVQATPINIGVYSNGVSWIRASCISEADDWGIVCSWIAESRSNGQNFIWHDSAFCVIP